MHYHGTDAIRFLANNLAADQKETSSHWQKYHQDFAFTGNGFDGVQGFGGFQHPASGSMSFLHRILQIPFRRMGNHFSRFPDFDDRARHFTKMQGRAYDLDVLRQTLTLSFLADQVPDKLDGHSLACVIGDGFASLTSLLVSSRAVRQVLLVNLSKTLMVDLWYLRKWMGEDRFNTEVLLVNDPETLVKSLDDPNAGVKVIALQAHNHALLQHCPIDLAINIASMQEMDPATIRDYFDDLRSASHLGSEMYFYCCNRVEKQLPDGTMVRIADYPWHADNVYLEDALCPWHQYFYMKRPPFYKKYDGPVQHRLVRF